MGKQKKHAGRVSWKDIALRYVTSGLEDIEALCAAEEIAPRVLRRAALWVQQARPDIAAPFEAYVSTQYPRRPRGRTPPTVGEVRRYRVQKFSDGKYFVRIPVGEWAGPVREGAIVEVAFYADQIRASLAP